jgi:hypothetical protein
MANMDFNKFRKDYNRWLHNWKRYLKLARCPLCNHIKLGDYPHLKCANYEQYQANRR